MELPPHLRSSAARQRGFVPPPHSSVNTTVLPSLLNVAPCQYAYSGSATASSRFGLAGSLMSISRPLPSHAPAAMRSSGYTVMSWHASVIGVGPQAMPDGWFGVCGAFWSPLRAPVSASLKSRTSFTTAAFWGAASGTLMTSIRHLDGLSPTGGPPPDVGSPSQPASSAGGRTLEVPET